MCPNGVRELGSTIMYTNVLPHTNCMLISDLYTYPGCFKGVKIPIISYISPHNSPGNIADYSHNNMLVIGILTCAFALSESKM